MYTVDDIQKEEDALFEKMPVDGYIEQRDIFLTERGLYDEWRHIYSKYVKLAQEGELEALKRALFYAWYQLSEPCWLSGIGELPDSETSIVVNLLEETLGQGTKDDELEYMLPYYMTVCDYYLERFYPIPNIQSASAGDSDNARSKAKSSNSGWSNRGQTGAYWG